MAGVIGPAVLLEVLMRKTLIAANWKMHKTIEETREFCSELRDAVTEPTSVELVLFPSHLSLSAAVEVLEGTTISAGAQDLFWESEGAYTGEVSGNMIIDAGARYVIVGHSERRHILGESNEVVARKLAAALAVELTPVFCLGETLAEREAGNAESIVTSQLDSGLSHVGDDAISQVVFAYEPVWAIGTGRTATPSDAEAMHRLVRGRVRDRYGEGAASTIRVLYGGSVKPGNARSLLEQEDVDGALVGGASLDLASFLEIARSTG